MIPRYFRRASTAAPLYLRRSSTSSPPFLKTSSSSGLHRSLLSLLSMQLSSCMKSPDTWSSRSRRVLTGTFTIFEQSFMMSLSSLQLVGRGFLVSFPLRSYFFSLASREVFRGRFFSVFSSFLTSLGSLRVMRRSLSWKQRQPSSPSSSTHETIFFISASPMRLKQSLYLDLSPSTDLFTFFRSAISSKHFCVMLLYEDSSSSNSRSSWSWQLCLGLVISMGVRLASTFTRYSWQVISGVLRMRTGGA